MDTTVSTNMQLKHRLRAIFDTHIFNFGDFECVFARGASGVPAMIGFRPQPFELIFMRLTPELVESFDANEAHHADPESAGAAMISEPWELVTVNLSNISQVADTGRFYRIAAINGFHGSFAVEDNPELPAFLAEDDQQESPLLLDQAADAEYFHEFMSSLMDEIDSIYAPSALEH